MMEEQQWWFGFSITGVFSMHMALPPSLPKESRAWWHKTVEGFQEPISLTAHSEVCPVNTKRSPIVGKSEEPIWRPDSAHAGRQRPGKCSSEPAPDICREWGAADICRSC